MECNGSLETGNTPTVWLKWGEILMASLLEIVQKWWTGFFCAPTIEEITAIYQASFANTQWLVNRHRFFWQRLHLWLWLATICLSTFILRNIYDLFFPLKETEHLPEGLKIQGLAINITILLSLLICFALHKTKFGHRRPGLLFLGSAWFISFGAQLFAILKGYALPDTLAWSLLFLSQAIFIPVRWTLHLLSQLSILVCYFSVSTALGLKIPTPGYSELYDVKFILYVFWYCVICNVGVYLYENLQRSEFHARQELESAYQKLSVTEAKYRNIFENAVEGIFQSSPDGRYITANPALARIYGYSSPEELIGYFTDIEHQLYVEPNRRAEFIRLIDRYGVVSKFESQIYRRDGSIVWISEKAYAVRDEQGKLLYYEGLIEDITQRKQAEESLRVFFHAVSHDLRNPVLGTLMVLNNLLSLPDEKITISRLILERMVQSSDRQLNLINSLLEAHVNEMQGVILQLEAVELLKVVEAAIADLEPILAENKAKLTNLITTDLPLVNADSTQLWRVFSNLIINAVKHNPPGLLLTLNASCEDNKIYCTVTDNGIGISQTQSQQLFNLYYRGDINRSVGMGLGLYLCKQIINAHGGEIGVKSELQAGATFWFTLPIYTNS